jgi:hypothetical protein
MYTISPFTTKTNKPSVNKIAGSDRITAIGLSTLFIIEKTSPASKNSQTTPDVPT